MMKKSQMEMIQSKNNAIKNNGHSDKGTTVKKVTGNKDKEQVKKVVRTDTKSFDEKVEERRNEIKRKQNKIKREIIIWRVLGGISLVAVLGSGWLIYNLHSKNIELENKIAQKSLEVETLVKDKNSYIEVLNGAIAKLRDGTEVTIGYNKSVNDFEITQNGDITGKEFREYFNNNSKTFDMNKYKEDKK